MSQGAVLIPTTPPLTGTALVNDINATTAIMMSLNLGGAVPTVGPGAASALVVGQFWLDTTLGTSDYRLKMYDGVIWSPFVSVDTVNHGISIIGTGNVTPPTALSGSYVRAVGASGQTVRMSVDSQAGQGTYVIRRTNGVYGSSVGAAINAGDQIGTFSWFGFGATAYSAAARGAITGNSAEAGSWTDAAQGFFFTFRTTPIGTIATAEAIRINGSGGLGIGSTTDPGIGALIATGGALFFSATAIPAGGTAGSGYKFSSTSNFGIFFGSGVPSLSAAKGSLYLRSDGAINARVYVNTDGGTTWSAWNTAS